MIILHCTYGVSGAWAEFTNRKLPLVTNLETEFHLLQIQILFLYYWRFQFKLLGPAGDSKIQIAWACRCEHPHNLRHNSDATVYSILVSTSHGVTHNVYEATPLRTQTHNTRQTTTSTDDDVNDNTRYDRRLTMTARTNTNDDDDEEDDDCRRRRRQRRRGGRLRLTTMRMTMTDDEEDEDYRRRQHQQ